MLQIITIPIILFIVFYFVGEFINHFCKYDINILAKIVVGLITLLTIFHLISIPFMYYELNFTPLVILFFIIILITLIFGIYFNIKRLSKKRDVVSYQIVKLLENKFGLVCLFIIVILILYQIFFVVYFQHIDADDSFYVSEISAILSRNYVLDVEPSTGNPQFPFPGLYKMVSWEVFLAFFCKLFHINAAFFSHTILPIIFIPIHYMVIYEIAKKLYPDKSVIFLLLYLIMNLFSGYSVYSQGAFLLFRIWQGKAILANIILPMLVYLFYNIYKNKHVKRYEGILLLCILICGLATSTVGLYLIPMAYSVYAITTLLYTKKIKTFLHICIPVILIIPLVFQRIYILFNKDVIKNVKVNLESFSWISVVENIQGSSMRIFILLIAIIIMLLSKNKINKYLLSVYSIILLLTYINPALSKYIASNITGIDVYWRIFWLLQMSIIITSSIIELSSYVKHKNTQMIIIAISTFIIIINGRYILNFEDFTDRENKYKISSTSLNISNKILENPDRNRVNLLAPNEIAFEIRQYSGDIILIWSRYIQGAYSDIQESDKYMRLYNNLYQPIYEKTEWNNLIIDELKFFKVNYVVIPKKEVKMTINPKLEEIWENNQYVLYRVN